MTTILILRPETGASATAGRARLFGFEPLIASLFKIETVAWRAASAALFDAILMTSANAAANAGPQINDYLSHPLFAVGQATEAAAQAIGFHTVFTGSCGVNELLDQVVAAGHRNILHVVGADHIAAEHPKLIITRQIIYRSTPVDPVPRIPVCDIILLHSARAAHCLDMLLPVQQRSTTKIVGISAAVVQQAGTGWLIVCAADKPTDDAMLACARDLCK